MTTFEVLISVAAGIVSLICTGAIPWGYMVGTRLARIESVISNGMKSDIADLRRLADEHGERLADIETSIAVLKMQTGNRSPLNA